MRPTSASWPLLLVAVALVFSDQNLLAPNLSQAARDFGLDDQARDEKLGGGLAAGLFIVSREDSSCSLTLSHSPHTKTQSTRWWCTGGRTGGAPRRRSGGWVDAPHRFARDRARNRRVRLPGLGALILLRDAVCLARGDGRLAGRCPPATAFRVSIPWGIRGRWPFH